MVLTWLMSKASLLASVSGVGNTTTRGGAGTVFFDDIRVYPCRLDGLVADFNGNCVVNLKNLAILVDSWLEKRLSP